MAKISYLKGVQCKSCGKILQGCRGAEMTISTPELCQGCGAHIINKDLNKMSYEVTSLGRDVVIKETRKLFKTYYEVVREF